MHTEPNSFDGYVIRNIVSNNQFGISEVKNLKSLKSIYFIKEEYDKIEALIKVGDIESLKIFPESQSPTGEYLEIMVFIDQNERRYAVTVYDSNLLTQDPQTIEIYPL